MLREPGLESSGDSLGLRHAADPRRMVHHPLALGDGELPKQEKAFARRRGYPVRIAATSVKESALRPLGGGLRQVDQFVLDLERAQRLEFLQSQDIGHLTLPSCANLLDRSSIKLLDLLISCWAPAGPFDLSQASNLRSASSRRQPAARRVAAAPDDVSLLADEKSESRGRGERLT